jgi:hypothetical protein
MSRVSKQLGAGLPEHIRKAWLDGEKFDFGQLFEVVKTKNGKPYHIITEMPQIDGQPIVRFDHAAQQWVMPPWVRVFRAYDHGYWPDPAVCLWFAVIGRQIICFKEWSGIGRLPRRSARRLPASREA